ncbi:hypothetical protein EIN_094130 [Entamoeba invadens IP1]|uniref:Chromo domain-containing protein n=1 Tax=Entamoeba invadens IP1 TaxID=370355 RepID=A0A0A1U5W9_ENTIV|nr:hypothetical protein EIN_094130 [Entamoeba invadens IP1]ELP87226.1 hypothetical protein EIN_094130 [Entamoeba invadens IP1]|eukprot:XP_004253997.1 hypothetical protein EIN_094130 [Entamoeba invadens IP1]
MDKVTPLIINSRFVKIQGDLYEYFDLRKTIVPKDCGDNNIAIQHSTTLPHNENIDKTKSFDNLPKTPVQLPDFSHVFSPTPFEVLRQNEKEKSNDKQIVTSKPLYTKITHIPQITDITPIQTPDQQTEMLQDDVPMNNETPRPNHTPSLQKEEQLYPGSKSELESFCPSNAEHISPEQKSEEDPHIVVNLKTLQIFKVITKYIPSNGNHPNKMFKYYVPSTQLFYTTYPEDKVMYLVRWEKFSYLEATWILEKEVCAENDRKGLVKKFEHDWKYHKYLSNQVIKASCYPEIDEIVPRSFLVPSKILTEIDRRDQSGNVIKMYLVKWVLGREVFVSEETTSMFVEENYHNIFNRFKNSGGAFPIEFTMTQMNAKMAGENILEKYDVLTICGGFGKRSVGLGLFGELMTGENKRGIIYCEGSSFSYYTDQLQFLFPGRNVTYINSLPTSSQLEGLLELELYDNEGEMKSQIVVMCCKHFAFNQEIQFDVGFVDFRSDETIKIEKCDKYIFVGENIKKEWVKKVTGKKCGEVEVKEHWRPHISEVVIIEKMTEEQLVEYWQIERGEESEGKCEVLRRMCEQKTLLVTTICDKQFERYRKLGSVW